MSGPDVQVSGRRNGKIDSLKHVHEDGPVIGLLGPFPERKTRLTNHQRTRKTLVLWRRRYEAGPSHFGATNRGGRAAAVACPHREKIWLERPHPRYGKAQPYFVPRIVAAEAHDCFTAVS